MEKNLLDLTSSPSRRSVLSAVGAAAVSVTGVTGQAAAQSTETTEAQPETDGPPDGVVAELGPTLKISDWDWQQDRQRFRIDLTSDVPNRIKLTDTGALMSSMTKGDGSGAFEIPSEGRTLESGESRLFFDGQLFQDEVAAVTVASPDGAVLLRTDSIQLSRPAVEYGTAGLMAGGAAIGSGWLSFKRTKEKMEESDEPEAERIA